MTWIIQVKPVTNPIERDEGLRNSLGKIDISESSRIRRGLIEKLADVARPTDIISPTPYFKTQFANHNIQ